MHVDWKNELDRLFFVDPQFKVGNEVDEILKTAMEEEGAAILMGMQGKGQTFKKIFGSISLKVARESDSPVFLIPEGCQYQPIKRIIYAANDLELDLQCIPNLIKIARPLNAEIEVVHIRHGDDYDPEEQLAPKLPTYSKLTFHKPHQTEESVLDALQSLSEQEVDLVAFATKRRSFSEKIFHKSMVKKFAIRSHTPLLILHGE